MIALILNASTTAKITFLVYQQLQAEKLIPIPEKSQEVYHWLQGALY